MMNAKQKEYLQGVGFEVTESYVKKEYSSLTLYGVRRAGRPFTLELQVGSNKYKTMEEQERALSDMTDAVNTIKMFNILAGMLAK